MPLGIIRHHGKSQCQTAPEIKIVWYNVENKGETTRPFGFSSRSDVLNHKYLNIAAITKHPVYRNEMETCCYRKQLNIFHLYNGC